MYSFYPTSITLICWAFAHPTFGKKAQATSASASQDPVAAAGVSENAPACPNDNTSLDDIIAKFEAMEETTERAKTILATAITLRDSRGRDRVSALRSMATTWNVDRREKGQYRNIADLEKDIEAAVRDAVREWESDTHLEVPEPKTRDVAMHMDTSTPQASQSASAEASARADEGAAIKRAKTLTAAEFFAQAKAKAKASATEHTAAPAERTGGTIYRLSDTPKDVMSLERLGPNMFKATLRSGETRRGDAELLETLPQFVAKLAKLEATEFFAGPKANAKAKATAKAKAKATAGDRPRQQESTDEAPSAKKPRTLTRMFQASAAEQVGGEHAEAPVRVDDCGEDIESDVATHSCGIAKDANSATTSTELFAHDKDEDKALLEWLREHPTHPRCAALLQQI